MKKQRAFTIAELLIVFGIIGVVSMLLIPKFLEDTRDRQLKIMFKRDYRNLSEATESIKADNNDTLANAFLTLDDFKNGFAKKLKTVTSCDSSSTSKCWNYNWKQFNKTPMSPPTNSPGLVLVNGTVLIFENAYFSSSCTSTAPNVTLPNVCSDIMIDVNGVKDPNTVGKDIFFVWVVVGAMKPAGSDFDSALFSPASCITTGGGWGCAYKVIADIPY